MESCLLRTQKAAAARGEAATSVMQDAGAGIYCRCDGASGARPKRAIAAVNEGDMLTTQMAVLKRFGKRATLDTIALRRSVAAAVQAQDRYPVRVQIKAIVCKLD